MYFLMSFARQPWTNCFVSHIATPGTSHLTEALKIDFNASGITSTSLLI